MSDDEERPQKRMKRDPDDEDDSDDDSDDEEVEVVGPNGKKTKGKGGSSCHQCKSRRNFIALTYCTSNLDKQKNKKCRKKFCGHCLKKFYKENAQAIADKGNWKCPSCRKICCCAACRRRKNKEIGAEKEAGSPAAPKPKKSSSHKGEHGHKARSSNHHRAGGRDGSSGAHHNDGASHDGDMYEDDEDGSSHRRNDRSLMGNLHSPRMGSHMMDSSPMQRGMGGGYDLDSSHQTGEDDYSSDQQHSYSDEDEEDASSQHGSDHQGNEHSDHDGGHGGGVSGQYAHMHDDDPQASLPSSQFTQLLSTHIKTLAEESARNPATSPFARLYQQAQQIKIKKKIKTILLRADIKKEKKVELIAALLAPLEDAGSSSAADASAPMVTAQ